MPLHTKILLGLLLGAVAGVAANITMSGDPGLLWFVNNVANPVGQVFLAMLFMVVIPLVISTLALGVAGLGDIRKLGRLGGKTIAFFLLTTGLAAIIGLTLVNIVKPGTVVDEVTRASLMERYSTNAETTVTASQTNGFGIGTFVAIVPRNIVKAMYDQNMLALIFFSLMFGVALTRLKPEVAAPVIKVLEGVAQAVIEIIGFAMKLAPFGVFGLIFSVTATTIGFDVIRSLGLYVVMVLAGLFFHQFVVIPLLARQLAGIPPLTFLHRCRFLMMTAFSTSSSNATLPTTIRTAEEEFGVPRQVAGFVIPLGATMNMNGTALFEGMTVLFLAQVFGIDLSLGQQAIVVVMAIITAVGAAGVPGGSIPLLVMIIVMMGIPGEAIALILGVDRILDMTRTVPNVTGDLLTSLVVAKSEGYELIPAKSPDFSSAAAAEALQHDHAVEERTKVGV
jgi:dicarboxylate/amino acid:cation (Na+ or H+) symporter, DAACS family